MARPAETRDNREMALRSLLGHGVLGGVLFAATPAAADVFKLYGEIRTGGTFGTGLSGDRKDDAFFARAAPPTYGVLVGGRFLVVDASLQHHQYLRLGSGAADESELSTWTQFDVGLGFSADLAGGDEPAKQGGEKPDKRGAFIDMGVKVGFGVGTGEQVEPPLSNDEVTDKGFVVEGRIGVGTHLNNYLDVGVQVPVAWGYYFKSGEGAAANDRDTHYRGLHGAALVYLRANVKIF